MEPQLGLVLPEVDSADRAPSECRARTASSCYSSVRTVDTLINYPPQNTLTAGCRAEVQIVRSDGYTPTPTNWQAGSTLFEVPYTNIVSSWSSSPLLLAGYVPGVRPDWVKLGLPVQASKEYLRRHGAAVRTHGW